MLGLLLAIPWIALFAGIVTLIVRCSGRSYEGQITESLGNEVDYDNPYPGWGARLFGANAYFEKKVAEPPAVPFEKWSESRSS